ncbi:VOC family protein [Thiomicrorhabdus sp. zzn3]|uniref:VOC family protein n=1 Tax=Thiomicrorhabdus sp. zzn3 TaxID=3039775 RepID=UPI0024369E08|nr:VOC family protein [Thiomicrorhabdus sp. zzn3]MDG6777973.1 VOC family protein [Thiomicrorhabdus sp. zzn3]
MDHVSIIVSDAERSLKFYRTLLGLTVLPRPHLGFPGYWLDLHNGQSLHIMQLDNPNKNTQRPEHGGRDYHFALRIDSVLDFASKLDRMNIRYTLSRSGRKALFVRDPDQNAFELFEYSTHH